MYSKKFCEILSYEGLFYGRFVYVGIYDFLAGFFSKAEKFNEYLTDFYWSNGKCKISYVYE